MLRVTLEHDGEKVPAYRDDDDNLYVTPIVMATMIIGRGEEFEFTFNAERKFFEATLFNGETITSTSDMYETPDGEQMLMDVPKEFIPGGIIHGIEMPNQPAGDPAMTYVQIDPIGDCRHLIGMMTVKTAHGAVVTITFQPKYEIELGRFLTQLGNNFINGFHAQKKKDE